MESLPDCQPGERLSISIAKEDGDKTVTFSGVVRTPEKDGSYMIDLKPESGDSEDGDVPIKKSSKAKAAVESKKGKKTTSKAAAAVLDY